MKKSVVKTIINFSFKNGAFDCSLNSFPARFFAGKPKNDYNFTLQKFNKFMAIETAGQKPARATKLKIDNQASFALPKNWEETIRNILDFVPLDQQRGIEKIKIVDFIKPPPIKTETPIKGDLPGLYHPKAGNQNAYLEISAGALLQPTEGFAKKMMAKSQFKNNLAGMLFSLVGQHYFFALRQTVNKKNLEPQIRQYATKSLKEWSEKQNVNSKRAKFFKPFQPYIEKWAKWLNKKALDAQKKS